MKPFAKSTLNDIAEGLFYVWVSDLPDQEADLFGVHGKTKLFKGHGKDDPFLQGCA